MPKRNVLCSFFDASTTLVVSNYSESGLLGCVVINEVETWHIKMIPV